MPRTGATIYDLLLSCPGDVLDLKVIVDECVVEFNRLFGVINNTKVELKHWSTDSYPQTGGKPQALLNNQFIHQSDACVAIFGNRFGTPTDDYKSGTEEEIEDMIKSGKQVFLYFIERQSDPKTIDPHQLIKVREFRDKYTERGIYCTVTNNEEFKKQFLNHLSLYFLNLITESETNSMTSNIPILEFAMADGENEFKISHSDFANTKYIKEKELKIQELIKEIKKISIEPKKNDDVGKIEVTKEVETYTTQPMVKLYSALQSTFGIKQSDYQQVKIKENKKENILTFCKRHAIEIDDNFWKLGSLKKEQGQYHLVFAASSDNLVGTAEEKRKYGLINELWIEVFDYDDYFDFFVEMDKMFGLNCIIRNVGKSFDEDVDVKIIVPIDTFIKPENLPIPGITCIKEINDSKLYGVFFCGRKNDLIEQYSDYPNIAFTDYDLFAGMSTFGRDPSVTEKYENEMKKYNERLNNLFCYEYFKKDGKDILKFNISYLKQNTSMYLPTILFFGSAPKYLEYQICSKHIANVISGKIQLSSCHLDND